MGRVMKRAEEMAAQGKRREDDNEEALRVRLDEYYSKTEPLVAWYESKGLLLRIDGTQSIEAVQADIRKGLGL
jgi:adenylate kinase